MMVMDIIDFQFPIGNFQLNNRYAKAWRRGYQRARGQLKLKRLQKTCHSAITHGRTDDGGRFPAEKIARY
ncbi:MAG: hypothetical protein LLG01_10470 [Planctomycetaceae bacterium]|nr:hypothetical protein [Planctomycetaceae bacterium]